MVLVNHQGTKSVLINSFNSEPLSLRQIYSRIGKKISMQAVHKHLKELTSERVIIKNNNKYTINRSWIESEKRKLEIMQRSSYDNYTVTNISFESINEMDDFLIELLKDNDKKTYSYWRHLWWPLSNMKKECLTLKNMKNKKHNHIITSGNSVIEKWCAKSYKKMGFDILIDRNFLYDHDFIIADKKIIQIYWPDDLIKQLDKSYQVKDIRNLNLENLSSVFESKTRIELRILEDEFLCGKLKKKLMNSMKIKEAIK